MFGADAIGRAGLWSLSRTLVVTAALIAIAVPLSAAATNRVDDAVLSRIEATLPAVKGMRVDAGQAALVDLMLHAPASVRFAIGAPKTAYDEVQLAPLKTQTQKSLRLAMNLSTANSASASTSRPERLRLSPSTEALSAAIGQPTDVAAPALTRVAAVQGGTPKPVRPNGRRVGAIEDEGRVFWYAMGASALTSLGTRVFLFFPALILSVSAAAIGAFLGPVATFVMFVGMFGGVMLIDSALAALAGAFVFDSMSRFYEASFVSGFLGQVLGSAAATAAVGIMVGFGMLYFSGVQALVQFTGTQVLIGISALSILGLMPVVVLGFFATVVFPAVGGAWAMSMTAQPIEGFQVDPTWDPDPILSKANPRELRRAERRVFAPIRVAIPGT